MSLFVDCSLAQVSRDLLIDICSVSRAGMNGDLVVRNMAAEIFFASVTLLCMLVWYRAVHVLQARLEVARWQYDGVICSNLSCLYMNSDHIQVDAAIAILVIPLIAIHDFRSIVEVTLPVEHFTIVR